MTSKYIEVYVELHDEGTETWRRTRAEEMGNGLYKLLAASDYDPEDEAWAFLPGDLVGIELIKTKNGESANYVRHPDPNAVRIYVHKTWPNQNKRYQGLQSTHALKLENGLYRMLATPQYNSTANDWEFPPDSVVRLEKVTYPGTEIEYLLAVSP